MYSVSKKKKFSSLLVILTLLLQLVAINPALGFTEDSIPPTVGVTYPGAGEVNVEPHQPITVKFTEVVSPGESFKQIAITDGYQDVPFTIDGFDHVLFLYPTGGFAYDTTYTVTIPMGAVVDLSGNPFAKDYTFNFTTAKPTINPPTVKYTDPPSGATQVPLNKTLLVNYDKSIIEGPNLKGIQVYTAEGQAEIICGVNYKYGIPENSPITGTNQLYIMPVNGWQSNTTYKVYIPEGAVYDEFGNLQNKSHIFMFSTIDTLAPVMMGSQPGNGATGVAVDSTLSVKFNEYIKPGENFNNIYLMRGTRSIAISKSMYNNMLYLDPLANLKYNTDYTLVIPAGAIKDAAGNYVKNTIFLKFSTQKRK